jgi:hypothetical protein
MERPPPVERSERVGATHTRRRSAQKDVARGAASEQARARPSQGSTGPRLKSEKSSSSFRDGVVSGASAGAVTKRTT